MGIRTILERRAHVRRVVRELFDASGFLEVDTPVLAAEVLPEAHIDPVSVRLAGQTDPRWLQASPENLMKRLLASGAGPIYQFAPAFRDGERGPQHDVEFTILEWYAPGTSLDDVASLLERLCAAVLGTHGLDRTDCSTAFLEHAGVDPTTAAPGEMLAAVERHVPAARHELATLAPAELADRCFELLLSEVVQPRLGHARPAMLEGWPASQAAFALIDAGPPATARRFELFVAGIELVNGWEEETGRGPLEARIAVANEIRRAGGRAVLPVPARLVAAHGPGMPAGVGAALGFDRLVMLAAGAATIDAVRCFPDGR